jgi:hypothetical protein
LRVWNALACAETASRRVERFSLSAVFSSRNVEVRRSSRVEKEVRALEMDVCRRVVAFVGKMVKQVMLVHSAAKRQRGMAPA